MNLSWRRFGRWATTTTRTLLDTHVTDVPFVPQALFAQEFNVSKPDREQIRLSLSSDILADFRAAKTHAEESTGLEMSNSEFLLALLRRELKRRQGDV